MSAAAIRPIYPVAAALVAAMLVYGAAGPATANDVDEIRSEKSERQRALEDVTRDLEESRQAQEDITAEIAALAEDRAALTERLIKTAREIQDAESMSAVLEERIDGLQGRENELRDSLAARSGLLAELLGALQRMGRRPPPAVLVSPGDALGSVRSAMVLGGVLPELRSQTDALATDLQELVSLKRAVETERGRLVAQGRRLDRERARIGLLLEARAANIEANEEELGAVRARAAELAAQATDMRELIAALDREIAVAEREAAQTPRSVSPREALGALQDPSRLEPAMPFDAAQGLLPLPAAGKMIREFGTPDDFDMAANGISIATREHAQVTAPSDGWVVYAGPFRSYGKLLIINVGDGYHVLLAGMERIGVELGQFVLAGEPVGTMGGLVLASAENVTVGRTQPVLYVEFRKDGRSIDPAPWWADEPTGAGL